MKLITLVLIAIATVSVASQTATKEAGVIVLRNQTFTDLDGNQTKTLFSTTNIKLEQTPNWNGVGNPPLKLADAIELTKEWISKKFPFEKSPPINEISVRKIEFIPSYINEIHHRWCYAIKFEMREKSGTSILFHHPYAIVLFDGTIIEPEIVNQ